MLKGIDVLVYDIQDIGCRSYTFISTMGLAMEAAGEAGIKFYVLDRPDPLNGNRVEGMMLDPELPLLHLPVEHPLRLRHDARRTGLHDRDIAGLDQEEAGADHRAHDRLVPLDVLGRHRADVGAHLAPYPDRGNGAELRGHRLSRRGGRDQSRHWLHAALRGVRASELQLLRAGG